MATTGLASHFVAMAGNNAWSNHRLLSACKGLTPAEFAERRTGFFPSLRATLNHILWVDIYYIDALSRDPTVLQRYNDPPPDFRIRKGLLVGGVGADAHHGRRGSLNKRE